MTAWWRDASEGVIIQMPYLWLLVGIFPILINSINHHCFHLMCPCFCLVSKLIFWEVLKYWVYESVLLGFNSCSWIWWLEYISLHLCLKNPREKLSQNVMSSFNLWFLVDILVLKIHHWQTAVVPHHSLQWLCFPPTLVLYLSEYEILDFFINYCVPIRKKHNCLLCFLLLFKQSPNLFFCQSNQIYATQFDVFSCWGW